MFTVILIFSLWGRHDIKGDFWHVCEAKSLFFEVGMNLGSYGDLL